MQDRSYIILIACAVVTMLNVLRREMHHDRDTVCLTEYAYCTGMNAMVQACKPLLFRQSYTRITVLHWSLQTSQYELCRAFVQTSFFFSLSKRSRFRSKNRYLIFFSSCSPSNLEWKNLCNIKMSVALGEDYNR